MKQTILFLLVSLLAALPALGHGLRVFAWPEGDIIAGETSFGHNRGAKNCRVTVLEATGSRVLLTLSTDDRGTFRFPLPEEARNAPMDLRIVVQTADGHRGEWLLRAADYAASETTVQAPPSSQVSGGQARGEDDTREEKITVSEERLRAIVARELERQLAPIRRTLAEDRQHPPGLRDILGGLGYIFGLAGLAAWWLSRRKP